MKDAIDPHEIGTAANIFWVRSPHPTMNPSAQQRYVSSGCKATLWLGCIRMPRVFDVTPESSMTRSTLHLILHALVPGLTARLAFPKQWKWAWLVMMLTMVIDLDHLLATPVYDPNRCGIGFHPLHSPIAIGLYCGLTLLPASRIVGIGLLIHIALDGIDCLLIG